MTTSLYTSIKPIFPEVDDLLSESERESPYLVLGYLADWLGGLSPSAISPDIKARARQLAQWCESQPRTSSADDDVWTIYTVAFLERLMRSPSAHSLVPILVSKANVLRGRKYFLQWIGRDAFDRIISAYGK